MKFKAKTCVCFILILSVIASSVSIVAFAEESRIVIESSYRDNLASSKKTTVLISNGKNISEYSAQYVDNDLFLPVDVYSKITRFGLSITDDYYNFKLGRKIVSVDKLTGVVQVYYPHGSGGRTKILEKDGTVFLSASVMLPWLNVQCSVENNVFHVIPDELSFWEVSEDLSHDELFNLTREWGDSSSSVIGLSGMMVFDTFLNLRWDRLVPSDKSENTSLYDYRCYVSTFVDMATDDTLKSEKANKIFKTVFSVNGKLDDLDELLHLDKDKLQSDTSRYLMELGFNSESMNTYYQLSDAWNDIRSSMTALSKVNKYMKPFQILKSYETIAAADLDYLEYLDYLDKQLNSKTIIGRAVNEANSKLDKKTGVLASYLLDLGGTLFDDLSLEKTAEDLLADAVDDEIFLKKLSLYLSFAKVFYSTVIPVADGFEGMSKAGVVSRVMQHSWDTAHQLSYNTMTKENLMLTCQAYMSALKASKSCFVATQEVMNGFGGKNLMKFRIDPNEELIIKLAATAVCRENDSVDNKEEYSKNLLEMFMGIQQDTAGAGGELVGDWFVYLGGFPHEAGGWYDVQCGCVSLYEDGSVEVHHAYSYSEWNLLYAGNWSATTEGKNIFIIKIVGAETVVQLRAILDGNRLIFEKNNGENIGVHYNVPYERDLSFTDWENRQGDVKNHITYKTLLKQYAGINDDAEYTLYDIDKDEYKELIIRENENHYIYTYDGVHVQRCGDFYWNYWTDCLYMYSENGLIVHDGGFGSMRLEYVYLYTLTDENLEEADVLIDTETHSREDVYAYLDTFVPINMFMSVTDETLLDH